MFPKKILPFILCFLSMTSCVEKLDFSQLDDYSLTPEYTTSIIYFTILPIQFFNQSGIQETERSDITDFRVFENSYLKNNLVKVDFDVEIKNEFDSDFTIIIEFLDDNNLPTHIFQVISVNANNLNYKFSETVEVITNPNIKNTTRIKVTARLDASSVPLNPNDTSEFEYKSSAKIYIDTDV